MIKSTHADAHVHADTQAHTLQSHLDCLRGAKKQTNRIRFPWDGDGLFFDWTPLQASPDSSAAKYAVLGKSTDEFRPKNAECFPIKQNHRTAKKNASRCMEIIVFHVTLQPSHAHPQRLVRQLLTSCATITKRWWKDFCWWGQTAQVVENAISYLSQQHGPQKDQIHGSGNPNHRPSLESLSSWKWEERVNPWAATCRQWDDIDSACARTHVTYSLGLVLTSTRRGPLLLKHCLSRISTSEKGLRNTRSPFMANNFFPTSRPAILKRNMGTKGNK